MKKPFLLLLFLLLFCPVSVSAMSVSGKVTSPTSIKISWKGKTKYKYWRIRKDVSGPDSAQLKWKTVKTLKISKKSYVLKKLKKGKFNTYEITFGNKKNGKFKPMEYDYVYNLYTGVSPAWWDDYASSDAERSPAYIDLWGADSGSGLSAKGIQIYRKVKGGKWKKIKTVNKKSFTYRDNNVKAGTTYYYKLRSYGKYKGKTIYSPWSDVMQRSAINQPGQFTNELISSDTDSIEIKLASDKYNGDLVMDPNGFYFKDDEYYEEQALNITKISKDGENWTTPGKITLKAGESIYLKFAEPTASHDLSKVTEITNDYVKYDGWPCFLYLTVNGAATAPHNDEYIH